MSVSTRQPLGSSDIQQTRWRLDPERSTVGFDTRTFWGLVTVHGRFQRFDGTLDLRDDPAIELIIDAGSVDTRNKLRDRHLRSADFFDVVDHPQARFTSDSATIVGEQLKVRGHLDAAGKSMPLELDATLRRVGDELELRASTDADHQRLGMTHSTLGMIRTPSRLTVSGRLVRDAG